MKTRRSSVNRIVTRLFIVACFSGSVMCITAVANRIPSESVRSLQGSPEIQVIAFVDRIMPESLSSQLQSVSVVNAVERQLQSAKVAVVPWDTSNVAPKDLPELKYLPVRLMLPNVAIMEVRIKGTSVDERFQAVGVALDVLQQVKLVRSPESTVQARTWKRERYVDVANLDAPELETQILHTLSDLVNDFMEDYHEANP